MCLPPSATWSSPVRSKVGLGGSGEKFVRVLTGEDPQALAIAAMAVEKDLRTIPGLGQFASSARLVRTEVAVRPDFARAADLGVTSSAIGETLRVATVGDYDAGLAMLTGILCIYIVLVLLFKNFFHPFTILTALPLSLRGAFVMLLLTGKSFSMPSLIGLILLMGIATKNSILLVEYAIVAQRDHGLSRMDALLDACHKRARPILLVIPAVFTAVDDFGNWLNRLSGRGQAQQV